LTVSVTGVASPLASMGTWTVLPPDCWASPKTKSMPSMATVAFASPLTSRQSVNAPVITLVSTSAGRSSVSGESVTPLAEATT